MVTFLTKYDGDNFIREDYTTFFDKEISQKTAGNDLSKMVEGGFLLRSGKGPKTSYVRTKMLPDVAR